MPPLEFRDGLISAKANLERNPFIPTVGKMTRSTMTKPITDKAEVALEYPDKLYVGTFERSSRFEAHLDPTGVALIFGTPGR